MSLRPGSRVGHYDVLELLGEGGMGVVFRAYDQRLCRDVALKLIHSDLAADPNRLARFQREARMLASLSHPNIATIHGLEDAEGEQMLVMELVPGETLAERVAAGPLGIGEALHIAAQIAAATEAAHHHGIIHRDLKPANIKLMPDGTVKVLDFGLAKALGGGASGAHSPTMTSGGTGEGTILGTATYMSPEQARGKDVDTRTDIWAFGCVLYEMLTGRSTFGAETLSDSVAAILTRAPDWSLIPAGVPSSIQRLLQRCLVKDARHRLRDIGDARLEIEDALHPREAVVPVDGGQPGAQLYAGTRAAAPAPLAWRAVVAWVGVAFVAGVLAGAGALWLRAPSSTPAARSAVQFGLPLAETEHLAGLDFPSVAISPADSHIAYVATRGGGQQLFVRALSGAESVALSGTDDALSPFFSPDGRWIGFFAGGKLKKVPITGGAVQELADAPIGFGGSWGRNDMIAFAPNNASGIWQVSAQGGPAHAITTLDTARGEFSHRWPELLPDGKSVLFTVGRRGSWNDAEIVVQSIATGERRTVIQGGSDPHYLADGRVLFAHDGSLFAAPFDTKVPHVSGEAQAVLVGVAQSVDGAAQASTSPAGSLVYVPGSGEPETRALVWVDRQGGVQPLAAPRRTYSAPRISPDGRTIAVTVATGDRDEVWTYDVARNRLTQLTFNGGFAPTWSSDGGRIVFSSSRDGQAALYSRQTGASRADQRLARSSRGQVPAVMSSDGTLAIIDYDASGRDISLLRAGDTSAQPFLASAADEMAPAFSPDGRWLAFVSNESGRNEVYICPSSDAARRTRVSTDGGSEPVWRSDGTELFFRSGTRLMVARVRTRPNLAVEPALMLFDGSFETGVAARPGYDVSPDGARFLMVQRDQESGPVLQLRIILGWVDQLRRSTQ